MLNAEDVAPATFTAAGLIVMGSDRLTNPVGKQAVMDRTPSTELALAEGLTPRGAHVGVALGGIELVLSLTGLRTHPVWQTLRKAMLLRILLEHD